MKTKRTWMLIGAAIVLLIGAAEAAIGYAVLRHIADNSYAALEDTAA